MSATPDNPPPGDSRHMGQSAHVGPLLCAALGFLAVFPLFPKEMDTAKANCTWRADTLHCSALFCMALHCSALFLSSMLKIHS